MLEAVSKATIRLLMQEPFFGHLCAGMQRELDPGSPSLGVGLTREHTLRLLVNPSYWQETLLGEPQRLGALKHQLLHIALKHVLRADQFIQRRVYWIAADLVVNQYLSSDQLAPEAITIDKFEGFEPWLGVAEYYELLVELMQQEEASAGGDALERLLTEAHVELDGHDSWAELDARSAAEQRLVEQHINGLIEQSHARVSPREWGKLPGELQRYVRELLASLKPAVDWRRVLRLFAESSRRTRVQSTLRRPSRRYGTVPGIKIQREHRLMVVIDTSGSIQPADLRAFFAEIHHIWRQGAEILVVECDAQIQRTYPYRGQQPEQVMGGGGTLFDPPLQLANDTVRPDAILYFTDAYAPLITVQPRQPVLWIIHSGGAQPGTPYWDQLPGRKINLPVPTAQV